MKTNQWRHLSQSLLQKIALQERFDVLKFFEVYIYIYIKRIQFSIL